MIGNSIDSTPLTPFPDPPSHSGEEPASDRFPAPVVPPKQPAPAEITTSSEDDLSLLLTQPVPDPFLDEAVSNPPARQSAGPAHPSAEGSAPLQSRAPRSDSRPGRCPTGHRRGRVHLRLLRPLVVRERVASSRHLLPISRSGGPGCLASRRRVLAAPHRGGGSHRRTNNRMASPGPSCSWPVTPAP